MEDNKIMVMSILTYYANQIFNKTKLYEFRKSPLRKEDLNRKIYIYSAKEEKSIVGTFKVSRIICGSLQEVLHQTQYDKRPDKGEIVSYFGNAKNCFALELYDIQKFDKPLSLKTLRKIDPNIKLPQYYDFIKKSSPIYNLILQYEKAQTKSI